MELSGFDIIEFTLFLISLTVYIQNPAPLYLKIFPVYFILSFLVGLIEASLQRHGKYNSGIYNIAGTIEFCFYFFVLRELLLNIKIKKVTLFLIYLFPILAFVNLYFQKKVGFNPVNFTFGSLLTVSLCIYYFVETFQKAETQSLARLPSFWITTAILFAIVLTFPFYSFVSFITIMPDLIYKNIVVIFYVINILISILYTIGFLCRIKIRKSIS
jgi:hypothetical protein